MGIEVRGCSHPTPSSSLWPGARNGLSWAQRSKAGRWICVHSFPAVLSPYKTSSQFWAEGHGAMSLVSQGCAWQFEMPFVMLWLLCSWEDSVVDSGELHGGQEVLMVWKPSPVMVGQCDRDGLYCPLVCWRLGIGVPRGVRGGGGLLGQEGANLCVLTSRVVLQYQL